MADYSKCTPDRVTEVRNFLASNKVDLAVRALADVYAALGQHASSINEYELEIDFPRVGLDVRVTRHCAHVIVHDPTDAVMNAVVDSGRSFHAIY